MSALWICHSWILLSSSALVKVSFAEGERQREASARLNLACLTVFHSDKSVFQFKQTPMADANWLGESFLPPPGALNRLLCLRLPLGVGVARSSPHQVTLHLTLLL